MREIDVVSDINNGHIRIVNQVLHAIMKAGPFNTIAREVMVAMDCTLYLDEFDNVVIQSIPMLDDDEVREDKVVGYEVTL
jgi:hypothetical protein